VCVCVCVCVCVARARVISRLLRAQAVLEERERVQREMDELRVKLESEENAKLGLASQVVTRLCLQCLRDLVDDRPST
jgi:hypothetical protein